MHSSTLSHTVRHSLRRSPLSPATALGPVLLLALAMYGCGGSEADGPSDPGNNPASSGGSASTPAPAPSSGAAAASNGGQIDVSPSTPGAGGTEIQNTPSAPSEGNTTPASVDGAGAGVGAVCAELGTSDACGACVCEQCGSELDTCAGIPGCSDILACVRENGCSGTECFCGDASLARCIAGEGDGPCKDVVLAAPGGKEPTLRDPSGGPASDAALAVGECAEDDDRCADICDVSL